MSSSRDLTKAKIFKNDEFYTLFSDIEEEVSHYVEQFKDKVVYCNCDDPKYSNFWKYFHLNFEKLGLKKLICTYYNSNYLYADEPVYAKIYLGQNDSDISVGEQIPLKGNGDFRSTECIELLKEADIVVTNPPFSLFREYVAQLMEYDKKFVIVGNKNVIAYKEFFPLLRDNKVFVGYKSPSGGMWFTVTDEFRDRVLSGEAKATYRMKKNAAGKEVMYCNCPAMWYTNLDLDKSHEPLPLTKNYTGNEDKYPRYDNYDAIDCSKVSDIPKDYMGVIGVPLTYIAQHCPEQFDILESCDRGPSIYKTKIYSRNDAPNWRDINSGATVLKADGYHNMYHRILIQRKPISQED